MKVQTQTEEVRRLRRTNLELIFSDHNAYCLPPCQNKCPSHIDIPGFLKQNAEAQLARVDAHLQAHDPVPLRARPRVPGPVRGALPARRGGRGDRDPRHRTATPATRSSSRCSTRTSTRRSRSSSSRRPAAGRPSSAPARPAWPPPTTCCSSGHDVTVFERDPAPGGMLRYGIPQYRLPKVEVLEAEYESVSRLGGKIVCNQGLGRDFTLDDLQNQGFDAVVIAIGCYDTNKLGIPGEDADGVLDGLEYLRTATLGLPYPGHKGKRVVVIGGGFTSMDCSRTSIRQGASEVTLVYRRDMKDMPAIERGPRGDRGRRHGDLPGRPDARHHRREQQGHRRRVHPDGARRAGRVRPAPPGARARHRVHDPLRPRAAGDRPGPGADMDRARLRAARRRRRTARLQADAVTFETGRPGVFGTGDVRIGAATVVAGDRGGPPRRLRRRRVPQGQRPGRDPDPPDPRRAAADFLSIVPFTARSRSRATG